MIVYIILKSMRQLLVILLCDEYNAYIRIRVEIYNPFTGKGSGGKDFSWTAALVIDMICS